MFDANSFNAQLSSLKTAMRETTSATIKMGDQLSNAVKKAANPLKEYESLTKDVLALRTSLKDSISPIKEIRKQLKTRQVELTKQLTILSDPKAADGLRNRISSLMGDIANLQSTKLKADAHRANELGKELAQISQKNYLSEELNNISTELAGNSTALTGLDEEYRIYLKNLKTHNFLLHNSIETDREREAMDKKIAGRRDAVNKIFGHGADDVVDKFTSLSDASRSFKGVLIQLAAASVFAVHQLYETFEGLRSATGATDSQAKQLLKTTVGSSIRNLLSGNFVGLGSSSAATAGLAEQLGTTKIDSKLSDTASKLVSLYNLSGEESGVLMGNLNLVADNNADMATNMTRYAKQLSVANNVPLARTFQDLAKNGNLLARYGRENVKNLIEADVKAHKFGLTLSKIDSVADSLLDFDSSIDAEMTASALIGKGLDFSGARAAALNNDLATVQSEIQNQLGSTNFAKLNRIQQNALARASGMSNEDMMKLMKGGQGELVDGDASMGQDTLSDKMGPLIGQLGNLTKALIALTAVMAFKSFGGGSMLGGLTRLAKGGMGGMAGTAARYAGRGIPMLGAGMSVAGHLATGDDPAHSMLAGGSTLAGGVLGAALGGPIGAVVGSMAGEALYDLWDANRSKTTSPDGSSQPTVTAESPGVERKLDTLITLMRQGGIAVNLDGMKVSRQLTSAMPKGSAGPKG